MRKLFTVGCLALLLSGCGRTPSSDKVLFIAVDGMASWCLETAMDSIPEQIPNLCALKERGLWTMDKRAEYKTSSAINWATIFMGVPVEMHGFSKWNSSKSDFEPYYTHCHGIPPTIFTLLQEQRPEASSVCVYDWDGIGNVIDTLAVGSFTCVPYDLPSYDHVAYTRTYGIPIIEAGMPVIFLFYMVDLDETGHKYGWGSPEYYASLRRVDESVGMLLEALEKSPDKDRTIVVVSSDHGGRPEGKHGSYDIRDFRTPLIVSGPQVSAGHIKGTMMQYDLTAMLSKWLGLKTPDEWRGRIVEKE